MSVKNWIKIPSQGGLSMIEVKKRAKKLGIETNVSKKEMCERIMRKQKVKKGKKKKPQGEIPAVFSGHGC